MRKHGSVLSADLVTVTSLTIVINVNINWTSKTSLRLK